LSLSIVTNGRLLKDINYCSQIISAGIDKISISLEGFNDELQDYITQSKNSFKDTIQAIKNFNQLNFRIDVITTLCNTNMHYWENITNMLSDLDFNQFVFNICTPSISPDSNNDEVPDLKELSNVIADMLNNDWGNKALSIVTPFPLCLLENKVNKSVKLGLCQMFHGNGLTIDIDGSVLPCTHFTGGPLFNIYDDKNNVIELKTFETLWSDNMHKFQEKLWYYPAKKCENCEEWKDCYGGCPLYWIKYNPEIVINETTMHNNV
jgi:radical SAM protein with 4Fe4S-binding SPASM domain